MKNKINILFVVPLILSLALSACAALTRDSQSQLNGVLVSALNSSSTNATPVPDAKNLSILQIAVGTVKLDGSTNAITASQATTLLTYWNALKTAEAALPQGGKGQGGAPQGNPQGQPGQNQGASVTMPTLDPTAAAVQTAAQSAEKSIYSNMTDSQLQAIAALNLNLGNSQAAYQALGITVTPMPTPTMGPTFTPWPTPNASTTLTPMPTPAGGQKPGNNPPGMGGGAGGNGGPQGVAIGGGNGGQQGGKPQGNGPQDGMSQGGQSQSQPGSQMNGQQPDQNGAGSRPQIVSSDVIDTVIAYLEKIAG